MTTRKRTHKRSSDEAQRRAAGSPVVVSVRLPQSLLARVDASRGDCTRAAVVAAALALWLAEDGQ